MAGYFGKKLTGGGIFRLDKIWYWVGKSLTFVIEINTCRYGIFRPKINGMWDTKTPKLGLHVVV